MAYDVRLKTKQTLEGCLRRRQLRPSPDTHSSCQTSEVTKIYKDCAYRACSLADIISGPTAQKYVSTRRKRVTWKQASF